MSANCHGDEDQFHSFLESLKGRMVTIYRHGPESKTGRLLDVQSDYIVLKVEDNKIVYYQIRHVKSISEDSKANQPVFEQDEEQEFIQEQSFSELFHQLKNEKIQINQGGPDMAVGTLVEASNDFIVLAMEDSEIVYFNLHHVKSAFKFSENEQSDYSELSYESEVEEETNLSDLPNSSDPTVLKAEYFRDLFDQLLHKWVLFNRQGPDALEGILVENAGSHYTIINNQEVLRINPFHIKCFSVGPKGGKNKEKDEAKEEQQEEHLSRSHHDEKQTSREKTSHFRSDHSRRTSHSRSDYARTTSRSRSDRSRRTSRRRSEKISARNRTSRRSARESRMSHPRRTREEIKKEDYYWNGKIYQE